MDNKTTLETLQTWQEQFPFALASYFWVAPSGKRICVAREFDSYSLDTLQKYKNIDSVSRINFERVELWRKLIELIKNERYPKDQIEACENFAVEVYQSLWNENDENESLSFFIATWPLLEIEKTHSWLKELDFEVFTLMAYRCTLAILFELTFGSRNFDVALENVKSYLALCSSETSGIEQFNVLAAIKDNDLPGNVKDELIFKRLQSQLGGRWNELTGSNIFFYSLNLIQFPTKYPAKSGSLRDHVLKSLEESGLPNAQDFLRSFECRWAKEANVS